MTKERNVKMRKWLTGLLMTVVLAFGVATPSYAAIVTPTVDAQAAAVVMCKPAKFSRIKTATSAFQLHQYLNC